jgi:hypothetical protein
VAYILATGFLLKGNEFSKGGDREMKPLWIGMMAITFVMGTGIVAIMYILSKMVMAYAKGVS